MLTLYPQAELVNNDDRHRHPGSIGRIQSDHCNGSRAYLRLYLIEEHTEIVAVQAVAYIERDTI